MQISHIPHCWKSHVSAHMQMKEQRTIVVNARKRAAGLSADPDLIPNCLQRLSADDKSCRYRVHTGKYE